MVYFLTNRARIHEGGVYLWIHLDGASVRSSIPGRRVEAA
jgi:hypothetical protein